VTVPPPPASRGPRVADAAAVVLLVAIASVVNWAYVSRHPELVYNLNFLFGEEGINLALVRCLLGGGVLYRDLSIPYGPLPIYAHAGLAAVLGNGMSTMVLYCHLASVAFLVLCYAAIRRQAGVATALLVTVVGLIPTALIPGAPTGGGMFNAYTPFERCIFALAFLVWEPLTRRSVARSLGLGMVLGLAQWVKFGGVFFVGAPIAVLDLIVLVFARADGPTRRARLASILAVAAGFLAVEGARDLTALLVLPRPVAVDVIWPGYAKAFYTLIQNDAFLSKPRFPTFVGWPYFFGRQLNVVASLAVGLLGLAGASVRLARSLRMPDGADPGAVDRSLAEFRMLLPLLFYMAGSLQYFGHVFIFMKYYAFLVLATAPFLERHGLRARIAVGLLWLPGWVLMAKIGFVSPRPAGVIETRLADGQTLWLSAGDRSDLDGILAAAGLDPARKPDPPATILIAPFASGFGVVYGLEAPPRDAFFLPAYIRPYNLPDLAARFESARALIVMGIFSDAGLDNYLAKTFDRSLLDILARREIRRVRINDRRTVILLK
jgi:hypothetical protein